MLYNLLSRMYVHVQKGIYVRNSRAHIHCSGMPTLPALTASIPSNPRVLEVLCQDADLYPNYYTTHYSCNKQRVGTACIQSTRAVLCPPFGDIYRIPCCTTSHISDDFYYGNSTNGARPV